MKTSKAIILVFVAMASLFWSIPSQAGCTSVSLFPNNMETPSVMKDVFDHLFDAEPNPYLVDGKYHVCFVYSNPDDPAEIPTTEVELNVPAEVTQDIIIQGLRFEGADAGAGKFPLVINHNGSGKLTITDTEVGAAYQNGGNGIKINKPTSANAGLIEIDNLTVMGKSENDMSDVCLDVAANNTVIKNSSFAFCKDSIMVRGTAIRVESVLFEDDLRGVHVAEGAKPVFVSGSRFNLGFGRQENWIIYDGVSAGVLGLEKHSVDNVVQVFAITPEPPVVGSRIDFFDANGVPCGVNTLCNYFENSSFPIPSEIQALGSATFKVMDDKLGLELIGIFTSPTLGSSVASNKIDGRSGVVAFVQTPYDIPTSPESGGDQVADDTKSSGSGADGSGGFSAVGGCMSISTATRTSVSLAPWWVILMLASMVPARVIIKNRKR